MALEREAVRVEEVRGPVQRDHRLARARTALHDEHARQRAADDLVLLALDGGDDVGEPSGATELECGDERLLAAHLGEHAAVERRPVGGRAEQLGPVAEVLVLDAEQLAPAGGEVAAAIETHRRATGGSVERFGHGRPPVDDDGLLALVGHGEAADVIGLALLLIVDRGSIDASEDQRGVAQLEITEATDDRVPDHISLEAGLFGAAPADLDHRAQTGGAAASGLETGVRVVDVGLFGFEIGMESQPSAVLVRGTDHAIGDWEGG